MLAQFDIKCSNQKQWSYLRCMTCENFTHAQNSKQQRFECSENTGEQGAYHFHNLWDTERAIGNQIMSPLDRLPVLIYSKNSL